MASKRLVFVGLLLAIVLISSEVAARELAATSTTVEKSSKEAEKTNGIVPDGHGYGGGGGGGGGGYGYGHGHGGGGYGCHKCCGYHGCHCCGPNEKPDAEPQAEPQN